MQSNKTCQPASAIRNFFSSHKISVDWIQGNLAQQNLIEFPDDNNTFRLPKDTFYSTQYSLDANFRKEAYMSFGINKFTADWNDHGNMNDTFLQLYSRVLGML